MSYINFAGSKNKNKCCCFFVAALFYQKKTFPQKAFPQKVLGGECNKGKGRRRQREQRVKFKRQRVNLKASVGRRRGEVWNPKEHFKAWRRRRMQ